MTRLDDIIARHGSAIARVAATYEADPTLRQDLVQDLLLAIHLSLPQLKDPALTAPFIFRIAHNRCVTHVVQSSRRRRLTQSLPEPDPSPSPEDELLQSERNHRLAAALRRLPLAYRQVLSLALEGMSYGEIAAVLDISVSNAGVRLTRGKTMLKDLLDG